MSASCPYAKSDMTPCVRKDGDVALDDRGRCVGCGRLPEKSAGPMTRASLIEAAARRMFIRMAYNPEEDVSPWEEQPHETRQWYRDFAEAAFVFPPGEAWIAPVDPTKAMAEAFLRCCDQHGMVTWQTGWRVMRDAHLKETEPDAK